MDSICTRFIVKTLGVLALCGMTATPEPVLSQQRGTTKKTNLLETITVSTDRVTGSDQGTVNPRESTSASPDSSELVEEVAGANVTSNGPVSGQVQYRGMTGERMNVKVDDHALTPGGPNWMDPPLHYLPRPLMEEMTVHRGLSPVSSGIATIGGTAEARMMRSHFADGDEYERHGQIFAAGRSVDEGYSLGGITSVANDRIRFHVLGSVDQGDDRDYPEGTIRSTEYDRELSGMGLGYRTSEDTYGLNFRHTDTGRSGNPSLPMDIVYMNTETAEARYATDRGPRPLKLQLNWNDVEHRMDNYGLRPVPDFNDMMNPGPAFDDEDRRSVFATSEDVSLSLSSSVPYGDASLRYGLELSRREHEATVYDPNSSFFVDAFKDNEREVTSGYLEWSGPLSSAWTATGGIRLTHVNMTAGLPSADETMSSGGATPAPLERLRQDFIASDRDRSDLNVDLQTELRRKINRNLTVSLALARKNRSPSYIERFAWVPIEATGGLADGNNHVGNVDLDPETSRDVEFSFEWSAENAHVTPRFFYRDVEGYIQGTPFDSTPDTIDSDEEMVSSVNGDPTPLKYRNVDAQIYGADATWGYDLPRWRNLRLDGTLSYLRGRRKDISDNLYRFAPSQADVQVSYHPERWLLAVEGQFVDEQDDVSATNDEPSTAGYGLMSLRAQWYYNEATTISLGLNNVFDKTYREHLAGFNRVSDSDVPTYDDRPTAESRIPGNERNLVATVNYAW